MNEFNIAIDLHGTYDADPDLFNGIIAKYLGYQNIDVIIFSGAPVDDIRLQVEPLLDKGVADNIINPSLLRKVGDQLRFLSVVDECFRLKYPMRQREKRYQDGHTSMNWYIDGPDELWWPMKAMLCRLHNIDIIIDDKHQYQKYFGIDHGTDFIHYNINGIANAKYYENAIADLMHHRQMRK